MLMKFYGIKDFYKNKELYQIKYLLMTTKQKKAYKRYVYSISFENEYAEDLIWEYLNNEDGSNEKLTELYMQRINPKKRRKRK